MAKEMITYYFGEAEVTLRSSGTEPKIKFYSEMPLGRRLLKSHFL